MCSHSEAMCSIHVIDQSPLFCHLYLKLQHFPNDIQECAIVRLFYCGFCGGGAVVIFKRNLGFITVKFYFHSFIY